jgi:thioredoxin 1
MFISVTKLTEQNFHDFISTGVSVVDIKADWCKPCQVISPIIDEISTEYEDVRFGKMDADECGQIVTDLGIRNIPTILIYKDGQVVDRSVGIVSKSQLSEMIDNHL